MRNYNYKVLQRKNNNEGIVGLSAIKGPNDPVAHMSDLKAMEKRLTVAHISDLKSLEHRLNVAHMSDLKSLEHRLNVAHMSDLKATEKRINTKIDELKQIILDRK
jgi:predicted subunit of tRNA(5-methylaminomethyl-2-thiouridylate) methyltransferase